MRSFYGTLSRELSMRMGRGTPKYRSSPRDCLIPNGDSKYLFSSFFGMEFIILPFIRERNKEICKLATTRWVSNRLMGTCCAAIIMEKLLNSLSAQVVARREP